MKKIALASLLISVACSTPPRVSTLDERAAAFAVVTTFETALVAAQAAGEVDPAKATLAFADIAEVRKLITDSEVMPLHWADIYTRVLGLAAKWAIVSK